MADRALIGLVLSEVRVDDDLGDLGRRQIDVETALTAPHGLAGLHDKDAIARLDALALAAGNENAGTLGLENVAAPGTSLQLRHDFVQHVRDRRSDGPVIECRVIASFAAETQDGPFLGTRRAVAGGGKEDAPCLYFDQPQLDLRPRHLLLRIAEKARLGLDCPAELGQRTDDQRVGADDVPFDARKLLFAYG